MAHSGALKALGVDDATLERIRAGELAEAGFDDKDRQLVALMRKVNLDPHGVRCIPSCARQRTNPATESTSIVQSWRAGAVLLSAQWYAIAVLLCDGSARMGDPVDMERTARGDVGIHITLAPTCRALVPHIVPGEPAAHYEIAISFWNDAASDGGDIWTAHLGPVWQYRPTLLGTDGFVEFGTSIAYVSERRLRNRDLGTRGHFTSHVTLGWYLGRRRRWHTGLRIRHTSNAGLGSPNPGLDIVMFELGYHWNTPVADAAD